MLCEAPIGSESPVAEDLASPTPMRRTDDPEVASLLHVHLRALEPWGLGAF